MEGLENKIKRCPMCGKETLLDEMIWVNGECPCSICAAFRILIKKEGGERE